MISLVKQTDVTDCGAACAKSVLSYFQINQSLASIKMFHPFKIGYYSFSDLSQIFEKYNLEAVGYFSDFENLMNFKNPIIAHVKLGGILPHFIVIKSLDNDEITYMEPSQGCILKIKREQFLNIWTGKILVVESGNATSSFRMNCPRFVLSYIINKRSALFFFFLFLTVLWVVLKIIVI